MVGLGARAALVAVAMLAMVFAGCVGDENVDPETDSGAATDSSNGGDEGSSGSSSGGTDTKSETTKETTSGGGDADAEKAQEGCKFSFCIEGHVYAPVWDEGMTWTYLVEGAYYPVTGYEATFGVFKINGDHFLLGTNSEDELKNTVTGFGVMTGQVQKDSYGVLEHDAYQDLLGFLKLEDNTWKSRLWNIEFTMVKEEFQDIEHAQGTALGIRVNGAAETGDTITVEYASDAAWITKLEWKAADGSLMLSYTLTDYNPDGSTGDMKIWTPGDFIIVRGLPTVPLGAGRWIAEGEADLALVRFETDPGVTAEGRVATPSGSLIEASSTGGDIQDFVVGYEAGDWPVVMFVDHEVLGGSAPTTGNMKVSLYAITERTG